MRQPRFVLLYFLFPLAEIFDFTMHRPIMDIIPPDKIISHRGALILSKAIIFEEQIGFTASANTGDNLHLTVPHIRNKLI